jgi:hypothetical protein
MYLINAEVRLSKQQLRYDVSTDSGSTQAAFSRNCTPPASVLFAQSASLPHAPAYHVPGGVWKEVPVFLEDQHPISFSPNPLPDLLSTPASPHTHAVLGRQYQGYRAPTGPSIFVITTTTAGAASMLASTANTHFTLMETRRPALALGQGANCWICSWCHRYRSLQLPAAPATMLRTPIPHTCTTQWVTRFSKHPQSTVTCYCRAYTPHLVYYNG